MNYKVLFHIDEMGKWNLTLNNVKNLLADLGDGTDVVVVSNAEAVKYLDETSDFEQRVEDMEKLVAKNVVFFVCNNALKANDIEKSSLYEFAEITPAGVGEIVRKQNEGYLYIKP